MFLDFYNNTVTLYANNQKQIFELNYQISSYDVILMYLN